MNSSTSSAAVNLAPRFSDSDIFNRFEFISDQCNEFAKSYNGRRKGAALSFDPLVMLNVVQSALDDIWRYKVYHLKDPDKKANCVKRAAYFTKWIVKLRPLFFSNRPLSPEEFKDQFDHRDSSLLVNEAFAIHFSLATIRTEISRELKTSSASVTPTARALAEFIYDLHYRSMPADALMSIYQIFFDQAKGIKILK